MAMCFGSICYVEQLLRVLCGSIMVHRPLQPAAPPPRFPSLSVKQGQCQLSSSQGKHCSTGGSWILPFPVVERDWMRWGSSSPEQTQHLCDGGERPAESSSGKICFCKKKAMWSNGCDFLCINNTTFKSHWPLQEQNQEVRKSSSYTKECRPWQRSFPHSLNKKKKTINTAATFQWQDFCAFPFFFFLPFLLLLSRGRLDFHWNQTLVFRFLPPRFWQWAHWRRPEQLERVTQHVSFLLLLDPHQLTQC